MASKLLPADRVDIKVHTDFNGDIRCSLIEASMGNLYSMTYSDFCNFLLEEIPRLTKFQVLRVSVLDLENEYIELTERNFHKFVRFATKSFGSTDTLRINIKVSEGSSPAPVKPLSMSTPVAERVSTARKELGFRYKSPAQTEIDLKTQEVEKKKKEVSFLSEKYNNLSKEYQPRMFRDTSKSICGNCHLRGHDKKRCPGEKFDRALICGEIDKHPSEKKELSEIGKKKQAAEIELKTLKTELEIKTRILNEVQCSFETKIHDQLIDSDPDRYLTALAKPKEGLVKADTYILKRYYQGKVPENLKEESQIWKTIITSYEEKMKIRPPKLNCVQRELERRGGIPWPQQQDQNANQNTADSCTSTGQEYQQECQFRQPFPYNYLAYGQNYMYAYPGYMGYNSGIAQRQYGVPPSATITSPHQATPFMPMMSPMASPPPPPDEAGEDTELPPLPDKTAK